MSSGLVWDRKPALRDPLLVAAFEGWNDAGDAATAAADWLIEKSGAERFASIDSDDHVDYQSRRPHVEIVDGVAKSIAWPAHEFFAAPFGERDLVVLRAVEPNIRWKQYCQGVIAVARETRCSSVVTFGALLGDVPHTRRIRVTGTSTDADLSARLGLVPSRYEGPTGIVGVLHDVCRQADARSASLWAPVPHYVATPPNPPATRALLERFAELAGITLQLDGFDQLVDIWRLHVDRAISDDAEVQNYVRELEARTDAADAESRGVVMDADEAASADGLVDEVERFLREHGDEH
jgi:proteasome assembly chaperone (PAC2) family protein